MQVVLTQSSKNCVNTITEVKLTVNSKNWYIHSKLLLYNTNIILYTSNTEFQELLQHWTAI